MRTGLPSNYAGERLISEGGNWLQMCSNVCLLFLKMRLASLFHILPGGLNLQSVFKGLTQKVALAQIRPMFTSV